VAASYSLASRAFSSQNTLLPQTYYDRHFGRVVDELLRAFENTELGAKDLLNSRMAYVAVSRGAYDAQIFTNDREKLGAALGHDVSHSSAHAPEMKPEQKQEQAVTP
jgi:hypothetical protein